MWVFRKYCIDPTVFGEWDVKDTIERTGVDCCLFGSELVVEKER